MSVQPARGLPPRVTIAILGVVGIVFLAIMGYFLRIGFGETGSAFGKTARQGDAVIAATPAPVVAQTDEPGVEQIPQSGGAPVSGQAPPAQAPAQPQGAPAQAGGPPGPVMQAISAYRSRLAANPNDLAALVGLANMEQDANMPAKAVPLYRRAIALDPNNPDTRTDLAIALHASGHDLEALRELDTVLAKQPNFGPALFNRGVIAQAIGRRTEAVASFRAFLKTSPNDAHANDAREALKGLGA